MTKFSIIALILSGIALLTAAVLFLQVASVEERVVVVEQAAREGSAITFGGLPPDWTDPANPAQSAPLQEADIPADVLRIEASEQGFTPNSFMVKAGKEVQLAVTNAGEKVHTFVFEDPSLSEVAVGLYSGEARGISFFAPETPGEYQFFCNVPGHQEQGIMVVQ